MVIIQRYKSKFISELFQFLFVNGTDEPQAYEESLRDKFESLAKEYDSMINRICFGFSRSAEELKDYRQDVLLNIWQSLPRFRGESTVKTWIYRIAVNTCVSTMRKEVKTHESDLPDVIDESNERKMQIMELHDLISQLPQVDKAIILLWLEEFSYEEIAGIIGTGRNTVATRIKRAKDKLMQIR